MNMIVEGCGHEVDQSNRLHALYPETIRDKSFGEDFGNSKECFLTVMQLVGNAQIKQSMSKRGRQM